MAAGRRPAADTGGFGNQERVRSAIKAHSFLVPEPACARREAAPIADRYRGSLQCAMAALSVLRPARTRQPRPPVRVA